VKKAVPLFILLALNAIALFVGMHLISNDPLLMGMKTYASIYHTISENYVDQVDPEDIFESSLDKIKEELDPFTSYIPPRAYQYYEEESQGEFYGIGVEITVRDGLLTVISPIAGTPADQAGLRAGDQVTMIGDIDASALEPDEAIDHIRGAPGTVVDLKIRRPGIKDQFNVRIKRAAIKLSTIDYAGVMDSVGYIRLTKFALNSVTELVNALDTLDIENTNGLILDLRGNPGGFLEIAVAITGLFLPNNELIVSTGGRSFTENFEIRNFMEGEYQDIPMVVLVNSGSASASEILSGALQDYDRAVILGDTTFGKGLVQNITPLEAGGAFRLTVSKYFLPSGRIIQKFEDKKWSRNLADSITKTETIYKTRGGRHVYGGGGVVPDIIIPEKIPDLLEALLIYGGYHFDFAIQYLQDHGKNISIPLDDSALDEFRDYLETRGFDLPNLMETSFIAFLEQAQEDDADFLRTKFISDLQNKITQSGESMWQDNKEQIRKDLSRAVSRLAYSKSERYERYEMRNDSLIVKAMQILTNSVLHKSILNGNPD
jgi:carboxyl-terminal processing protease